MFIDLLIYLSSSCYFLIPCYFFTVSRIKFLFKAIHGFRETEKSHWNVENLKIINKIKQLAFDEKDIIPASHVLDLAGDG